MIVIFQFIIVWLICVVSSSSSKPPLTLDEFFNYTSFSFVTLSPDDTQSVLIQTTHRIWDRNVTEEHLYLHSLRGENRTLITTQASSFRPRWKGDLVALILSSNAASQNKQKGLSDDFQYIHLYSIRTGEMYPIAVGEESIHTYTWSPTSTSIYFTTRIHWSDEAEQKYKNEWKDVIEYEEQYRGDTIYRVDIENMTLSKIEPLVNISFRVAELICSPDGKQLVFSTEPKSLIMQQMSDYELYSLDLTNDAPLIPRRLTNNTAIEENLKWSADGSLFFAVIHSGSVEGAYEDSQGRLYNLNMTNNRIERWATQFNGQITEYDLLQGGREGVIMLGQLSTEIQVYTQLSASADLVRQTGWNGTYENLAIASAGNNSSTIVFIHSSYEKPQEVYFINNVQQLTMAQVITNENKLFTERNLPQGKSYQWINEDDRTPIEGVLLYPPDKFQQKNLPLFVLIHGGPYRADGNFFRADWYKCGVMMATEGWLVLAPNYRGSTGMSNSFQ
jgi:dipeptidyl aminopeptidase/acylaminoacyl peptidase